ncbi:S-layer protein [Deinococcus phoenicis]|uniref:S-layer protein n=1 Tax=Deinococcus phoenicis TaxID=1476583 RepID=A0A016QMH6_9DEIO|nr:DUF4384 domain-containing protein [Deinococcus phoenicis]EYB67355.1 S-layer protein [Deinococcus phoenicis]
MKAFLSVTALSALLIGTAGAAPVISAQSIIVNPVQSSLNVKVWTDRGSGQQVPSYAPGERIRLYTSVNQDAYVYLFNVDPQGRVDLILPNRYQGGANFQKANTTRAFPASGDPFTFDIAAPYGLNKVLALASRTPLNLDQIATFKTQQNSFATVNVQGQERLAQALSIVVNPVDQGSWVSDTAYYNVAGRTASAQSVTVQPAPSQPAPVRPAPIQPVRPAPVWTSGDWQGRDWQTSFERRSSLESVYAEYAGRLRAEGYTQVSARQNGNHLRGEFRQGGRRATLEVKQKGSRFEVQITRR